MIYVIGNQWYLIWVSTSTQFGFYILQCVCQNECFFVAGSDEGGRCVLLQAILRVRRVRVCAVRHTTDGTQERVKSAADHVKQTVGLLALVPELPCIYITEYWEI